MVAIVGGNALGLSQGSPSTLGQRGIIGAATIGRNGELAYVNAATGNLVLQDRDEWLIGRGLNIESVRTYNSLGQMSDDNGDNWSLGAYSLQISLKGLRNTSGSTLVLTARDGAQALYAYDPARSRYVCKSGAGADDTIVYDATANQYVCSDGDTGVQERYDAAGNGRLMSRRDLAGNQLSYAYNAVGLLTNVTDANGETTWYDYNGTNLYQIRTVCTVGGLSQTSTRVRYGYDELNRLSTVTIDLSPTDNAEADGKIYKTTYTYDSTSRRVASVSQQDGSILSIGYIQVGAEFRVASTTDRLGNVTRYSYDLANRRTTVTDPNLGGTTYEYDAIGQLTTITSPAVRGLSQVTRLAYNGNGDLIQLTDPMTQVVTYGYDDNGNQILVRDAAGNTVTRTYDSGNRLITETRYLVPDPDGAGTGQASVPLTTRYVYDAAGRNQLRFVVSPEGRVTEYRYNGFGQQIHSLRYAAATYPVSGLGVTATPTEAQMATWAASQDRTRLQRVDMAYDARGQLQKSTSYASTDASGAGVTNGSQAIQQFVYDISGRLLQTISPANGSTLYTYDSLGRELTRADAAGNLTTSTYDFNGNRCVAASANGLKTISTYDNAGRLVSVQQTNATSRLLGETRYFYDDANRLTMTQDPTGLQRWYLYDEVGRQVGEVDANGSLVETVYNANGLRIQTIAYAKAVNVTSPANYLRNTAAPTLASLRPATSSEDARQWWIYDSANRLIKTVDATGAVTETIYDGSSQAVKVIRYAGRVETSGLGAQLKASSVVPYSTSADRVSRHLFSADGLLLGELDAEGYLTEYTCDAAGRQVSALRYANAVADGLRGAADLSAMRPTANADDIRTTTLYDGMGRVTGRVDGENYLTESVYDTAGRLTTQVRYATRLNVTVPATATPANLRPTGTAEDQTSTWAYDTLDRVIQETNAEGTVTRYRYDQAGNLTSTTRAYGQAEVRTVNARFDLQGRLTGELSAEGAAALTAATTQEQIDQVWRQYGVTHTCDAAGRRTSTTDAVGNKTLFFFNSDSQLTHTVNALGEVEESRYDALGRVKAHIRYATRINVYGLTGGLSEGAAGAALAAAINAVADTSIDRRTEYRYNPNGTLASTVDAKSLTTTYSGNAFGQVIATTVSLTNGDTRVELASFDRRGLLVQQTRNTLGVNATTRTTYDAFGRVTRTDTAGVVRQQTHDRLGRVLQTVEGTLPPVLTTYDAFDRVLSRSDALKQTTTYKYSDTERSVTMTTPEGIVVVTRHTRFGQTSSVTDGRGHTTSCDYDRNGNLTKTTLANGVIGPRHGFDAANRLISSTDANGVETRFEYDAASRQITRTVDPKGLKLTTRTEFDALGQRISVIDANQVVTTYRFDLGGRRLTEVVDPTGLRVTTVYTQDAAGRTVAVTDPRGTVTSYTYDALGRRVGEVIDPNGLAISRAWAYDKAGNVLTRTEPNGGVTRFVYDAQNRLVYTIDALGGVVGQTWDANGNLQRTQRWAKTISPSALNNASVPADVTKLLVDVAGADQIEARRYDRDGRLRFTVDGTGAVVEYRYDKSGNVTERIAYANPINLQSWSGTTDPAVLAESARDRSTRTEYDALGRATYSADATGAVTRLEYDNNGNVLRSTQYANPIVAGALPSKVGTNSADRVSVVQYDAANRRTSQVDATGAVTSTEYDGNGNIVRTTQFAQLIFAGGDASKVVADATRDRITRFDYDAANRKTWSVDALNHVQRWDYDSSGNLTTTQYFNAVPLGAKASTVTADRTKDRVDRFVYDHAGRLSRHTDAMGFSESYTYNGLGKKLTYTNAKGSVWSYAYDAKGQLVTETSPEVSLTRVMADAKGDLVEGATSASRIVTALTYDAFGNLTAKTEAVGRPGEERTTRYSYDAMGRQVGVIYPPVGIYAEPLSALAANGATGLASRVETVRSPASSTVYNAFGEAVANFDVSGNVSYKAYDNAGRVAYEVDALGCVTGYTRNAFGDAKVITRFAQAANIPLVSPLSPAAVPTAATLTAVMNASSIDHSADRSISSTFDAKGRALVVTERATIVFDVATSAFSTDSKVTRNTYDAFGNLILVSAKKSASAWVDTYGYFDALGHQTVSIDAMGYVTAREYDEVGNLAKTIEYAIALTPASFGRDQVALPTNSADDRITSYAYDLCNRKTSETRGGVTYDDGRQAIKGALTTSYGYDALGNLVRTTDASGGNVYSYYDALGRVTAVAAPTRNSTASGASLTPLTLFKRDAAGNVVVKVELANGASSAVAFVGVSSQANPGYTHVADATTDRRTLSAFDVAGHAVMTTDANGISHFSSFDAAGRLAKTWQMVRGPDGATPVTLFQAYQYDALGRLVHTFDPAPYGALSSTATDTSLEYNAFGEVVRKGVNGGRQEFSDYDNAGNVWRTNVGDGVTKVFLYDLLGRKVSQITSGGGRNGDPIQWTLGSLTTNVMQSTGGAGNQSVRRTDFVLDDLGRLKERRQPIQVTSDRGIEVSRTVIGGRIQSSESSEVVPITVNPNQDSLELRWTGTNKVLLHQMMIDSLGSGDVRFDLEYLSAAYRTETGAWVEPRAKTYSEIMPSKSSMVCETVLSWQSQSGISQITRIVVSKKDIHGVWQKLYDQPGLGVGTNSSFWVRAPANPATKTLVQLRPAGSAQAWSDVNCINFGDMLRADLQAWSAGSYEYRVFSTAPGASAAVTSNAGVLVVGAAPLATIAVPLAYQQAGSGILAWQKPASPMVQAFNYRPAGSAAGWASLQVGVSGLSDDSVDTSALPAGDYEYELLWTPKGQAAATQHATGVFTVKAAVGDVDVPAIGMPAIGGFTATSTSFSWQAPTVGSPKFEWRLAGQQAWTEVATTAGGGRGSININGARAGTYEFRVTYLSGSAGVAQGTGTIVIQPQVPAVTPAPQLAGSGVPVIGGYQSSVSAMSWTAAAGTVLYEYRQNGTSSWAQRVVSLANGRASVDFTGLAAGSYDYRISNTNGSTLLAEGAGTFVISAQVPSYKPAPTLSNLVGVNIGGFSISDGYICWNTAQGTPTFEFRAVGSSAWLSPIVTNLGSLSRVGRIDQPPGDYEFRLYYSSGGTLTALAGGKVSIYGTPAPSAPFNTTIPSVAGMATTAKRVSWTPGTGTASCLSRPVGTTAWLATPVTRVGTTDGVDISASVGTFEYLISYSDASGVTALTTGSVTCYGNGVSKAYLRPNASWGVTGFATSSSALTWANPSTWRTVVEWRAVGSRVWSSAQATSGLSLTSLSLTGLASGTYECRVTGYDAYGGLTKVGKTNFTIFAPTAPAVVANAATVTGVAMVGNMMTWNAAASGTPSLEYRPVGTTTWQLLSVTTSGGRASVDLGPATPGTYEYRIAYTSSGNLVAEAGGRCTVYAVVPAYTPPPALAGSAPFNIRSLAISGNKLVWTTQAGTPTFEWRLAGTTNWNLSTVDQAVGQSSVSTLGLAAGTYEFRLAYRDANRTVTAMDGGTVTVYPTTPAYTPPPQMGINSSVYVPGYRIAGAARSFEVLNATAANSLAISVANTGGPTLVTLNATPAPVLSNAVSATVGDYAATSATLSWRRPAQGVGHVWARKVGESNWTEATITAGGQRDSISLAGALGTYDFRISYDLGGTEVAVGSGRFTAYGASSSALPTLNDTGKSMVTGVLASASSLSWNLNTGTPTLAYRLVGTQAWRLLEVNSAGGRATADLSRASPGEYEYRIMFSGTAVGTSTLLALGTGTMRVFGAPTGRIGSAGQTVRPTVYQQFDRWGNVVQVSDVRNSAWVTTYRWNHDNQVIEQRQCSADGVAGAGPVTAYGYDALGRQVTIRDANGNLNRQVYDAGGNLTKEVHADGGVIDHRYDAFGDQRRVTDAMNFVTDYGYDKLGHLTVVDHGVHTVYSTAPKAGDAAQLTTTPTLKSVQEKFTYDEAGRKITATDGDDHTTSYRYDLGGHVVQTTTPMGAATRRRYDASGHQISQTDANNRTQLWTADYFGRTLSHTDLSGSVTSYFYDNAGQLGYQWSKGSGVGGDAHGEFCISYSYDTAGRLILVDDESAVQGITFAYDLAGNKVLERTLQLGLYNQVVQDNHLAYDALGRLRDVADGNVHMKFEYDQAGNRTRVTTHLSVADVAVNGAAHGDTAIDTDVYYRYDSMNRQTLVDGASDGSLGKAGHQLTYDLNGNRKTDKYQGKQIVSSGGGYTTLAGVVTDVYGYDGLNRLISTTRNNVLLDGRKYDAAGRVVLSGALNLLPTSLTKALNEAVPVANSIATGITASLYDADGKLVRQENDDASGNLLSTAHYNDYDAAGNLKGYSISPKGDSTTFYSHTLDAYDGYVQRVTVARRGGTTSTSTQRYTAAGHLIAVDDSVTANSRTIINDWQGRALRVTQGGNVQRQLIVDDQVLGRYGVGPDPIKPKDSSGKVQLASLSEFSFGYQGISGNFPGPAPGSYTAQPGDTLQSIARSAYGDSQQWYRIAQANGLRSSAELKVGQTLTIPSGTGTARNTATEFKPYDASKIVGDTMPSLPMPAAGGGCGGFGQVIMIAVAIAVTVMTQGAAASMWSGVLGSGTAATVAGAATAAAVGSVAAQAVGIAIGAQDSFSWKQVALSAVSAGVTQGVTQGFSGTSLAANTTPNIIVRTAISGALTQGIGVATGLQKQFNWRAVAASAVGVGVGDAIGESLGLQGDQAAKLDGLQRFARSAVTGIATGTVTALARGGRVSVQQVATDAFGNALGESLVDAALAGDLQQREARSESIRELNRIRSGLEGHQSAMAGDTYTGGLDWADDVRARRSAAAIPWAGDGVSMPVSSGYLGYSGANSTAGVLSQLAVSAEFRLGGGELTSIAGSYGGGYTIWDQVAPQRVEITYHRGTLAKADQALAELMEGIDSTVQRIQDEGAAAYARGDRLSAGMTAVSYLPDRLVGDTLKGIVSLPRLYTSNDMLPGLVRAASNPVATARAGYNAFSGMSTQDKIASAVELLGPAALKFGPGAVNWLNGLPVLGADVGAATRGLGRWVAPAIGDAAFSHLDRMGLVLRAASGGTPPGFVGPVRPSNWEALTGHPDAHAFTVHGGSVTDSQLITRALTGVKPGGSSGPIPPLSSAFYSNSLLIDTDLAIRSGGGLNAAIARQPGMSTVRVEVRDVGDLGANLGYGYRRVGATGNASFNSGAVGPLQRLDNLSSAQGIYEFNSTKGLWETITVYPAPW